MAEQTVNIIPTDINPDNLLPVVIEQEPQDPHVWTLEALQALDDDFNTFQWEVYQKMKTYRQALSNLSCDMYKEMFVRMVGGDTSSFCHENIFQGWHGHGYRACDQVKSGLDDMSFAIRHAKTYCRALQRPRGQKS